MLVCGLGNAFWIQVVYKIALVFFLSMCAGHWLCTAVSPSELLTKPLSLALQIIIGTLMFSKAHHSYCNADFPDWISFPYQHCSSNPVIMLLLLTPTLFCLPGMIQFSATVKDGWFSYTPLHTLLLVFAHPRRPILTLTLQWLSRWNKREHQAKMPSMLPKVC